MNQSQNKIMQQGGPKLARPQGVKKGLRAFFDGGFSLRARPSEKPTSILDEVPGSTIPAREILVTCD